MTQGFDHDLYMKMQTEQIVKRIEKFDNKLYLEFGGKLFDDYHAARVLPGFEMNAKIRILQELKEKTEIIFCIGAAGNRVFKSARHTCGRIPVSA